MLRLFIPCLRPAELHDPKQQPKERLSVRPYFPPPFERLDHYQPKANELYVFLSSIICVLHGKQSLNATSNNEKFASLPIISVLRSLICRLSNGFDPSVHDELCKHLRRTVTEYEQARGQEKKKQKHVDIRGCFYYHAPTLSVIASLFETITIEAFHSKVTLFSKAIDDLVEFWIKEAETKTPETNIQTRLQMGRILRSYFRVRLFDIPQSALRSALEGSPFCASPLNFNKSEKQDQEAYLQAANHRFSAVGPRASILFSEGQVVHPHPGHPPAVQILQRRDFLFGFIRAMTNKAYTTRNWYEREQALAFEILCCELYELLLLFDPIKPHDSNTEADKQKAKKISEALLKALQDLVMRAPTCVPVLRATKQVHEILLRMNPHLLPLFLQRSFPHFFVSTLPQSAVIAVSGAPSVAANPSERKNSVLIDQQRVVHLEQTEGRTIATILAEQFAAAVLLNWIRAPERWLTPLLGIERMPLDSLAVFLHEGYSGSFQAGPALSDPSLLLLYLFLFHSFPSREVRILSLRLARILTKPIRRNVIHPDIQPPYLSMSFGHALYVSAKPGSVASGYLATIALLPEKEKERAILLRSHIVRCTEPQPYEEVGHIFSPASLQESPLFDSNTDFLEKDEEEVTEEQEEEEQYGPRNPVKQANDQILPASLLLHVDYDIVLETAEDLQIYQEAALRFSSSLATSKYQQLTHNTHKYEQHRQQQQQRQLYAAIYLLPIMEQAVLLVPTLSLSMRQFLLRLLLPWVGQLGSAFAFIQREQGQQDAENFCNAVLTALVHVTRVCVGSSMLQDMLSQLWGSILAAVETAPPLIDPVISFFVSELNLVLASEKMDEDSKATYGAKFGFQSFSYPSTARATIVRSVTSPPRERPPTPNMNSPSPAPSAPPATASVQSSLLTPAPPVPHRATIASIPETTDEKEEHEEKKSEEGSEQQPEEEQEDQEHKQEERKQELEEPTTPVSPVAPFSASSPAVPASPAFVVVQDKDSRTSTLLAEKGLLLMMFVLLCRANRTTTTLKEESSTTATTTTGVRVQEALLQRLALTKLRNLKDEVPTEPDAFVAYVASKPPTSQQPTLSERSAFLLLSAALQEDEIKEIVCSFGLWRQRRQQLQQQGELEFFLPHSTKPQPKGSSLAASFLAPPAFIALLLHHIYLMFPEMAESVSLLRSLATHLGVHRLQDNKKDELLPASVLLRRLHSLAKKRSDSYASSNAEDTVLAWTELSLLWGVTVRDTPLVLRSLEVFGLCSNAADAAPGSFVYPSYQLSRLLFLLYLSVQHRTLPVTRAAIQLVRCGSVRALDQKQWQAIVTFAFSLLLLPYRRNNAEAEEEIATSELYQEKRTYAAAVSLLLYALDGINSPYDNDNNTKDERQGWLLSLGRFACSSPQQQIDEALCSSAWYGLLTLPALDPSFSLIFASPLPSSSSIASLPLSPVSASLKMLQLLCRSYAGSNTLPLQNRLLMLLLFSNFLMRCTEIKAIAELRKKRDEASNLNNNNNNNNNNNSSNNNSNNPSSALRVAAEANLREELLKMEASILMSVDDCVSLAYFLHTLATTTKQEEQQRHLLLLAHLFKSLALLLACSALPDCVDVSSLSQQEEQQQEQEGVFDAQQRDPLLDAQAAVSGLLSPSLAINNNIRKQLFSRLQKLLLLLRTNPEDLEELEIDVLHDKRSNSSSSASSSSAASAGPVSFASSALDHALPSLDTLSRLFFQSFVPLFISHDQEVPSPSTATPASDEVDENQKFQQSYFGFTMNCFLKFFASCLTPEPWRSTSNQQAAASPSSDRKQWKKPLLLMFGNFLRAATEQHVPSLPVACARQFSTVLFQCYASYSSASQSDVEGNAALVEKVAAALYSYLPEQVFTALDGPSVVGVFNFLQSLKAARLDTAKLLGPLHMFNLQTHNSSGSSLAAPPHKESAAWSAVMNHLQEFFVPMLSAVYARLAGPSSSKMPVRSLVKEAKSSASSPSVSLMIDPSQRFVSLPRYPFACLFASLRGEQVQHITAQIRANKNDAVAPRKPEVVTPSSPAAVVVNPFADDAKVDEEPHFPVAPVASTNPFALPEGEDEQEEQQEDEEQQEQQESEEQKQEEKQSEEQPEQEQGEVQDRYHESEGEEGSPVVASPVADVSYGRQLEQEARASMELGEEDEDLRSSSNNQQQESAASLEPEGEPVEESANVEQQDE